MKKLLLIVFTRRFSVKVEYKAQDAGKNAQQIVPADAQKAARR